MTSQATSASLVRQLTSGASTLYHADRKFRPLPLTPGQFRFFETQAERDHDATPFIQLRGVEVVGSAILRPFFVKLESNTFQVSERFFVKNLLPDSVNQLPPKNSDTITKLAIPVVVESSIRETVRNWLPFSIQGVAADHIVVFLIDFKTGKIEYYDSRGLTIGDRKGQQILNTRLNPPQFLNQLIEMYELPKTTPILENRNRHQKDTYNCPIFVANFLLQRSLGISAEEIFSDPTINSEAADASLRYRVLTKLYGFPEEEMLEPTKPGNAAIQALIDASAEDDFAIF